MFQQILVKKIKHILLSIFISVYINMDRIIESDIESRCGHLQSQNGIDIPNWSFFTSFLVVVVVSHWEF